MRLILILFTGFLFTQELQVEGNLNVTGTIESTTIDSLNQVILDLQDQIAGMQSENRLETRVFTTENITLVQEMILYPIDIQELVGTEVEHALITVLNANIIGENHVNIHIQNSRNGPDEISIESWSPDVLSPFSIINNAPILYIKELDFPNFAGQ